MEEETVVIMFPFMAQGHIIPFLRLALQLEQRTHAQITFVNTPLNIKKLRSSIPQNSCIRLVELPFCSTDHGLPPDSENTDTLPYPLIHLLLQAATSLKPSFHQLISRIITHQQQSHQCPRICIIADMFFGWTVDIANEFGIFHSIFLTGGAYGSALYFSLWLHLPHCETHDSNEYFSLSDFPEAGSIHQSQLANNLRNANGADPWSLVLQKLLPFWLKTHGILINTIEDLDQTGLLYFRRKTGGLIPIWPVAPSMYSSPNKPRRPNKVSEVEMNRCIDWLDARPPASVLFVSFGSQNTISCSQMMALAAGLEASGKNFIWVVRPPIGFDLNGEFRSDEWLPEGFVERIIEQNKGLLVHNWAPQLEILSHKSTCAFLSHCGWNSMLESLSHGVPIIGWPLSGEQYYNSKLLEEEKGVCIEVARGTCCEVKHEDIARAIETVMGGNEKGEEMRKKADGIKKVIEEAIRDEEGFKGSCVKAMDDFINAACCGQEGKQPSKR